MTDPTRYRYPAGTRRTSPPLYNPARASLPITGAETGYDSLYAGDMHAMSASHHSAMASRPPAEYDYDYRSSAVPVSSTTYAVRKDPIPRNSSVKESGSRTQRASTIDAASKRPIIITTKHAAGTESSARAESPTRDPYRMSNDEQYYAEPASSIDRARSSTRAPFSATAMDNDEYRRLRDRTEMLASRVPNDPYRASRPTVLYSNTPHRGDTMEYDDDGYEYTKPSDLARYDLDHQRPAHRSRRDSYDRYYRPTVSVSTHPYEPNDRRQRGPPPTTWGLDKVNRIPAAGLYDGASVRMPVPPAVPLAPDPSRRSGLLDVAGSPPSDRRTSSRPRPVSLIQDMPSRASHPSDEYYRGREDDLIHREIRDRDREYLKDENVTSRGFGLRIEPEISDERRRAADVPRRNDRHDDRHDRWDPSQEYDDLEPRRSDDDLDRSKRAGREDRSRRSRRDRDPDRDRERDREHDRDSRAEDDYVRDRKKARDASPAEDDHDNKSHKLRDKVAAGLGVAAASLGLVPALKDKGEKEPEKEKDKDKDGYKDAEGDRHKSDVVSRPRHARKDAPLSDDDFEIIDMPKKDRHGNFKDSHVEKEVESTRGRSRSELEPKANSDDAATPSRDLSVSTDDGKADRKGDEKREERTSRRRKRAPSAFNPNDTAILAEIKAKLAAAEEEKEPAKSERIIPVIKEPSPERTASPTEKIEADLDSETGVMVVRERDDSRGRELVLPEREERQVRVVSPPREKEEKKPIKGILKQPKPQFPEEPNPIREGVAPHKDDKTKADVPPGARWTKINRKMVNPEALTIGKERFEVRDDFVIVLRVLSKEEIQAYADATQLLRERRRKEYEREYQTQDEVEYDQNEEEEPKRSHRQHHRRDKDRDDDYDEDPRRERRRDRDRERNHERGDRHSTRQRYASGYEDEDEYKSSSRPRTVEYHGHHRSHRDRDRDRERDRERDGGREKERDRDRTRDREPVAVYA